jgi:tetratricopeptide (TPR) repeat protein
MATKARRAGREITAIAAACAVDFGALAHNPAALVKRVADDASLQSDAFAARLLYYDTAARGTIDPDSRELFIEAALIALWRGGSRDHDLLCRGMLARASARMARGHSADADDDIRTAERHAMVIAGDSAFYAAIIEHSRAALDYYMERDEEAAERLVRVVDTFTGMGEHARANMARTLLTAIEFRRDRYDLALEQLQREASLAHARGDVAELVRIYGGIATCYLFLGDLEPADEALSKGMRYAEDLGTTIWHAELQGTGALVSIRRDGAAIGLRKLESARQRLLELNMPGTAVITLLNAVELIAKTDPTADVIAPLCRSIQIEATRLNLRVSVAEATERLRVAALRHVGAEDLLKMVKEVRSMIDPGAQLAADEIAN